MGGGKSRLKELGRGLHGFAIQLTAGNRQSHAESGDINQWILDGMMSITHVFEINHIFDIQ